MNDQPSLGFVVDRWLGANADQMVFSACEPDSPAERAGLAAGDCVIALDGKPPLDFVRSAWWPRPQGEPITVE